MPGFDGWWVGVCGEKLDVQGVELVDGDHAFAIVVQIFHKHLAEAVDFAGRAGRGGVVGEEVGLGFQAAHEVGELCDNRLISRDIDGIWRREDEGKVEDEFVARVVWG